MTKRMVIMLILVGLVLGGIFGFQAFKAVMIKRFFATRTSPPQTVSTIQAGEEAWQPQLEAVGTLTALNGTDIAPELPGLVVRVNFKSGDEVKAGALLVELDTSVDRAQLRALQATHVLAQKVFTRDQHLLANNAISQEELDTAQASMDSSAAQVAAQSSTIDRKLVRAPFAGRLGIRAVDLGQYVNAGTKLVNLQQLDPIFADFFLPQKEVHRIAIGQHVLVRSDALPGQTFAGTIAALDSTVDVGTRNVKVRAELQNPRHRLLPGMFVTVDIDLGSPEQHITLPQTAITYNPYGNVVFLVAAEGQGPDGKDKLVAKQQFVTTGDTRGDQIAVLTGLKAGDQVVTSGQLKLRNGTPVLINNTIQPENNPAPTPKDP